MQENPRERLINLQRKEKKIKGICRSQISQIFFYPFFYYLRRFCSVLLINGRRRLNELDEVLMTEQGIGFFCVKCHNFFFYVAKISIVLKKNNVTENASRA